MWCLVDTGNSYQGLCEMINRKTGGKDGIVLSPIRMRVPSRSIPFSPRIRSLTSRSERASRHCSCTLWKKDNEPATRAEEVALSNAVSLYIGKLKEESDIVPCFNTFYEFVGTEYRKVLEEKKVREKDFDIDGFLNVLEPYYKGGEYDLSAELRQGT